MKKVLKSLILFVFAVIILIPSVSAKSAIGEAYSNVRNCFKLGEFNSSSSVNSNNFMNYIHLNYFLGTPEDVYEPEEKEDNGMYYYYKVSETDFINQVKKWWPFEFNYDQSFLNSLKNVSYNKDVDIKNLNNLPANGGNYSHYFEDDYFHFKIRYFNAGYSDGNVIYGYEKDDNIYSLYYDFSVLNYDGQVALKEYYKCKMKYYPETSTLKYISNEKINENDIPDDLIKYEGEDDEYINVSNKILEGKDFEYKGDDTYVLRIDKDMSLFLSIYIDDKLVDDKNYKVTEGSTVITFEKSYLNTLDNGKHEVYVDFADNEYVVANLTVNVKKQEVKNPKTSDINLKLILVASIISIFGIAISKKKLKSM